MPRPAALATLALIAAASLAANTQTQTLPALKNAFRDHFRVGVAINRTIPTATDVKANNVDRALDQVRADTATTLRHFDHVVAENDMKWEMIHPREGADGYDFAPADAFVEFGERHGMLIIGHTLVWHGQTPAWVFSGDQVLPADPVPEGAPRPRWRGFDPTQPHATRDQLIARLREHIHTVVGRYRGRVHVWDVVNEAISDRGEAILRETAWSRIIGPDFIALAFRFAHEADPEAILRYNDYGLENPRKRDKALRLVRELLAQGVPVHAIGTQTHVGATSPSYEEMDLALTELKSLGLPVHVTELDVNTARRGQGGTGADITQNADATAGGLIAEADARAAEQWANLFRLFVKHRDAVKIVTFWGVNDGVSWRAAGRPLLFDADNRPKPGLPAVLAVAREAALKQPGPAQAEAEATSLTSRSKPPGPASRRHILVPRPRK